MRRKGRARSRHRRRGRAIVAVVCVALAAGAVTRMDTGAIIARAGDEIERWTQAVQAIDQRSDAAHALSGQAHVVDGDTLDIDGERVRLEGIDTPEKAQQCRTQGRWWPCGQHATRALAEQIGTGTVRCERRSRDRYGRTIGVCRSAGVELNSWMVAQGWAFAYRRYSRAYVGEEQAARAANRGIWRGEVIAPWEWRRGKRLRGAPAQAEGSAGVDASRRCAIKGNISSAGRKIYHVAGGAYYERTKIDETKGERWFCSESAAHSAGWRRSKR